MATKRSIFEEVGAAAQPIAPQGGLIDGRGKGARRGIRVWLLVIFLLVALMIVVGGLTRLTELGAVDHRMEAGDRGYPAAECRRLGGGV